MKNGKNEKWWRESLLTNFSTRMCHGLQSSTFCLIQSSIRQTIPKIRRKPTRGGDQLTAWGGTPFFLLWWEDESCGQHSMRLNALFWILGPLLLPVFVTGSLFPSILGFYTSHLMYWGDLVSTKNKYPTTNCSTSSTKCLHNQRRTGDPFVDLWASKAPSKLLDSPVSPLLLIHRN